MRKILHESTAHDYLNGLDIKYTIVENNSKNAISYSIKAELFVDYILKTQAEQTVICDSSMLYELYNTLVQHQVTPIDLEYVIEDYMTA